MSREGSAPRLVEPDEMVPPLLYVVSEAADGGQRLPFRRERLGRLAADRGSREPRRPPRRVRAAPGRVDAAGSAGHATSNSPAAPMPPPMHRKRPFNLFRYFFSSCCASAIRCSMRSSRRPTLSSIGAKRSPNSVSIPSRRAATFASTLPTLSSRWAKRSPKKRFDSVEARRHLRLDIAELAGMGRSQVIKLRAEVAAIVLGMEPHVAQLGTDPLQMPRQQLQVDRLSHCQASGITPPRTARRRPCRRRCTSCTTTSLAPRRLPSISACPTMRAPDMP